MQLGVLKIAQAEDGEGKAEMVPAVAGIVSEYSCLYHGNKKHNHPIVKDSSWWVSYASCASELEDSLSLPR